MKSPAQLIDHTLLKAEASEQEVLLLCEEAVEYGFASVCVPPAHVVTASKQLYGSDVAVGTVVGFPLGYQTTGSKVFETRQLVGEGADEVDMVIQLGAASCGDFATVEDDISQVVAAAGMALVKVIVECCLFAEPVKRTLAKIVAESAADYVKTSTGFARSGATPADVALLRAAVAGRARVKAAGGIRDLEACRAMIEAGADRIGTSAGVEIMRQWLREYGGRL